MCLICFEEISCTHTTTCITLILECCVYILCALCFIDSFNISSCIYLIASCSMKCHVMIGIRMHSCFTFLPLHVLLGSKEWALLCAWRQAPDQRSPPAQIAQWSVAGRALVHQRSPPAHHEIGLCAGGALDVQRKLTSAHRPIRCDFFKTTSLY